jgi:hypothetical protein
LNTQEDNLNSNYFDVLKLLGRTLWKQYEYELPDAPTQVAMVMLKTLRDNGYTIEKSH